MRLKEFEQINELDYPGNIGMMEMFKFHQIATPEQKQQMKELLAANKTEEAWKFLQYVTKTKLQDK